MESSGKVLSGKRTIDMKMFHLFRRNQIEQVLVKVKYCPTNEMVADHYTNTLHGIQLRSLHTIIMNCIIDFTKETVDNMP